MTKSIRYKVDRNSLTVLTAYTGP